MMEPAKRVMDLPDGLSASRPQPVAVRPRGSGVVPYEPDPRRPGGGREHDEPPTMARPTSADSDLGAAVSSATMPTETAPSGLPVAHVGPVAGLPAMPELVDPRFAVLATKLETQIGLADELMSAFSRRALNALNEAGPLPIGHTARNATFDTAARLASTTARLLAASAGAAETMQHLLGGGHRQVIRVERAVFVGERGAGVARDE